MERAIKERLIGAALLVLAGVIIIPWLLDGKTSKPPTQRELLLPGSSSNQNETRVVSLDLPQRSKPEPASQKSMKLDARQVKAVGDGEAGSSSESLAAIKAQTTQPSTNSTRGTSSPSGASPPASNSSNQNESSQRNAGNTESSSGEPASAKPEPRLIASSESKPPATFSEPLPDSEPKTAPASTKPAPAAQASTSKTQWAVQVGSFASQENAERLAERLRGKNYAAFVMRNVIEGRVRFRVRVGPVDERAQADLLAAALKEDRQPARVLSHP